MQKKKKKKKKIIKKKKKKKKRNSPRGKIDSNFAYELLVRRNLM